MNPALTLLCLLLTTGVSAAATTPNIIYFMADDLGYGGLGCYGQQKIKTPIFDQLAAHGIRVPCLAAWPGRIAPGQTSTCIGASWDFFPTFAELAGAPVPTGIDGHSIVPTLLGGRPQPVHELRYWETVAGGHQAVRMGDWKGIRQGAAKNPDAPLQLFNPAPDPGETTDVAAGHPDIVSKVAALLKSSRVPSPEFPMGKLDEKSLTFQFSPSDPAIPPQHPHSSAAPRNVHPVPTV